MFLMPVFVFSFSLLAFFLWSSVWSVRVFHFSWWLHLHFCVFFFYADELNLEGVLFVL